MPYQKLTKIIPDIRNKLQSFFTILEKLEKGEDVPRKIVSVAKKDLKAILMLLEKSFSMKNAQRTDSKVNKHIAMPHMDNLTVNKEISKKIWLRLFFRNAIRISRPDEV